MSKKMKISVICCLYLPLIFWSSTDCVQAWDSPQAGWLLVLDDSHPGAKVVLVDIQTGSIRGKIATGRQPDFAVSSDHSKVFVVSGPPAAGLISEIDLKSGETLATANLPQRILYTSHRSSSSIAVSTDGRWLYAETMLSNEQGDEFAIVNYKLDESGISRIGEVPLPGCGMADLSPSRSNKMNLVVFCSLDNSIRRIAFDADGRNANSVVLGLPDRPYDKASGLMHVRRLGSRPVFNGNIASDSAIALTESNEVCRVSLVGGKEQCSRLADHMNERYVPSRPWTVSPDGKLLLFGSGATVNRSQGAATALEMVDIPTLTWIGSIEVGAPFTALAMNKAGDLAYLGSRGSITIVDLKAKSEVRNISLPNLKASVIVPLD
jgi:hypothetical protein